MALSFSRPDPSSPGEVAAAAFSTSRRGFDQTEVRDFLRMVAAELARLQERERFLERELRNAQRGAPNAAVALDDEVVTKLLGEEAARILHTARDAASQIKIRAEEGAARLLREATDEAQRLREEAEVEAARRRQDAASDADSELQMAKQQGREMVNEARAYRERVLSELARRREMARQQIEQLVHGRDRLLQAFERARLAAVDVMAELTPLGEPTEYVNLAPTTGPVPMMVPAGRGSGARGERGGDAGPGDAADDADATAALPTVLGGRAVPAADAGAVSTAPDEEAGAEALEPAGEEEVAADADAELAPPDGSMVAAEPAARPNDDAASGDAAASGTEAEPTTAEPAAVAHLGPGAGEAVADHGDRVVPLRGGQARSGASSRSNRRAANAAEPDDDATQEGRDPAPVVALFAGEIDDAADDGADDVFARLRAARAESVAERARLSAQEAARAESHPVSSPPTAGGPTAGALVEVGSTEVSPAAAPAAEQPLPVFAATPEAPADAAVADDSPFGRRDAALTPLIVAGARKLKRVLADEQNDVLHALRRKQPVSAVDALLPGEADHCQRYAAAIEGELEQAALAGAASVEVRTGAPPRAAARSAKVVRPAIDALASTVVAPLRERLARAVTEAGGDNDDIANLARAIYREWKTQRIDEHLDDVLHVAFGRGALAGLEPGSPVTWVPDPRVPVCPDCDDNTLAGAIAAGSEFPTGQPCAPAHEGCRCMLAPAHS